MKTHSKKKFLLPPQYIKSFGNVTPFECTVMQWLRVLRDQICLHWSFTHWTFPLHTHTFRTISLSCARMTNRCLSYRQVSGAGCRRSSSDAAYELSESVRAQRECRLRPHYSDPMPADATKRKQLEMKIAAAARLHIHRRERDSGKTLSTALSFAHRSCCK